MKKLRADNRGFTLLEVILSMAILAMISIPLMKYFTDSLRHAMMMEQKQKATLLAQDTIEKMKSQEKLIQMVLEDDETTGYWVPSLAGANHTHTPEPTEQIFQSEAVSGKSFDTTTGKGFLRLVREDYDFDGMQYDMVIDISTELEANNRSQAVVHGIDDRKNALIVERDEEEEALTYFLAVNATYKMGTFLDGGVSTETASGEEGDDSGDSESTGEGTGESGDGGSSGAGGSSEAAGDDGAAIPKYETAEELREFVKREINIELGGTTVSLPGGGASAFYYTIRVWYKYTCTNINDKPEVVYETGNIYESQMEALDSLYLLFNIFEPSEDVIRVNADSSVNLATGSKAPEIILVCQNMDALLNGGSVEEGEEVPSVTFSEGKYTPKLILNDVFTAWAGGDLKLRTNIIGKADEAVDEATKGAILKEDGMPYSGVQDMDSLSADIVRVVSIDLSVYKAGDYNAAGTGTPLVQMKTTKSE